MTAHLDGHLEDLDRGRMNRGCGGPLVGLRIMDVPRFPRGCRVHRSSGSILDIPAVCR